ncbi:hypothetical protein FZC78_10595 [Rossellomorea vietnamensis]|uniref:Uncharacterized protein n=1 Tax=Rossellomorea vietnamensis TaxID=218284 RepID=A0A5D4NUR0_9BACI|nr:hypothetical protein [Rossellomorea vietnamensis]TYS17066.1 hypothetical protein FZC78_10595 [Rossellomorea vietnamensis]
MMLKKGNVVILILVGIIYGLIAITVVVFILYYLPYIAKGVGKTIKQNEKILEQNEQLIALLKERQKSTLTNNQDKKTLN